MKNPFNGLPMNKVVEKRTLTFRKEEFEVNYSVWKCSKTGESFTTTELDESNIQQVYHQYRSRHNIPFPDEIMEMRERYGLSAKKMSEVLGFGVNSFSKYEKGEIPNISNGKALRTANDPRVFKEYLKYSESFDDEEKNKIFKKVNKLILEKKENRLKFNVESYILGKLLPSENTGFRKPSLSKASALVAIFASCIDNLYKTKLNKLLFYSDFCHFKETGFSITGLRYRAIDYGPVPENYDALFHHCKRENLVEIIEESFDGVSYIGEKFVQGININDASVFMENEIKTINAVVDRFKDMRTNEIINKSHQETAWKINKDEHKIINYTDGLDLCGV